jgi:hypothetical protein
MTDGKKQDYYQLLGVSRNASDDEINRAFRLGSREYADVHSGGVSGGLKYEKWLEFSHAYEVLSDKERRGAYDSLGKDTTGKYIFLTENDLSVINALTKAGLSDKDNIWYVEDILGNKHGPKTYSFAIRKVADEIDVFESTLNPSMSYEWVRQRSPFVAALKNIAEKLNEAGDARLTFEFEPEVINTITHHATFNSPLTDPGLIEVPLGEVQAYVTIAGTRVRDQFELNNSIEGNKYSNEKK